VSCGSGGTVGFNRGPSCEGRPPFFFSYQKLSGPVAGTWMPIRLRAVGENSR